LFPAGKRATFPPYDIKVWEKKYPAWFHQDLQTLFRLLQEGEIQPQVARTFPLEQAAEAQELLASGVVTGKIVLVM
jgi:NADPH:quinone reductase-like Zn-dependent oxidoreductase